MSTDPTGQALGTGAAQNTFRAPAPDASWTDLGQDRGPT